MLRGKERVRALKIAAVVISLLGMCLIVWSPDMTIQILGVVFAFLCALCYTVYIIELSSDALSDLHPLVTPGYVLAASAVFNFFRCLFSGNPLFTTGGEQLMYIRFQLSALSSQSCATALVCVSSDLQMRRLSTPSSLHAPAYSAGFSSVTG